MSGPLDQPQEVRETLRDRDAAAFPWDRASCYVCGDLLDVKLHGRQGICQDCVDGANEYADSFVGLASPKAYDYWTRWVERREALAGEAP